MSAVASGLLRPARLKGWSLAAEGAAILESERLAVIADVHLGYEWSRANGGDCLPPHSLSETLAKLDQLLSRAPITRLVVAGDLVESARPCPRTSRDVRRLIGWLEERGVELIWLRGNHDPPRRPALPSSLEVSGWTITHGDRPFTRGRAIFGHHHPVLQAESLTAPCFLIGPRTIVLPAFSPNAAGWDVSTGRLPEGLELGPMRCVAALGGEVLDFGPLDTVAARLRASISRGSGHEPNR